MEAACVEMDTSSTIISSRTEGWPVTWVNPGSFHQVEKIWLETEANLHLFPQSH